MIEDLALVLCGTGAMILGVAVQYAVTDAAFFPWRLVMAAIALSATVLGYAVIVVTADVRVAKRERAARRRRPS